MWPTSSSNSNQWSFNPAAYQNVPYEQVDWATLAQQWIKMKETLPSVSPGLPPPPAPQISKMNATQTPKSTPAVSEIRPMNDVEGGEAPMDMDTKDDDVPPLGVATGTDSNWKQWNDWQSQWGWGWPGNAGTVPLGEKTSSSSSTVNTKVKSLSNDSNPVLNNYVSNVGNFPNNSGTTSTPQVPGSFNYNKVAGGTIPPSHPKTGYYSETSYTTAGKLTSGKLSNKNSHQKTTVEQYLPIMDPAKKKKLPAWIREGLNKMEREKQKKMEYERMVQEKLIRNQLSPDIGFKSDIFSEKIETPASSPSVVNEDIEPSLDRYEKSRSSSVERGPVRCERLSGTTEDSNLIRKTKDQIMEESMLKVRRILTEFLLEATENQVATIAKEELRRNKTAPAQQIRKSNALTSLSGNLGLAAYDSDSGSSDSERDIGNRETDSDDELEMLIERKKRNFALIEDKIEEEIENQEYKERQVVQRHQEFENNKDGRNSKFEDRDKQHSQEDFNSRSRLNISEQDERTDRKANEMNSTFNNQAKNDKQENLPKNSKSKKRKRSSSSSPSSSESSYSTESGSLSSDRSASRIDSGSNSSRHSHSKRKDERRPRKKSDVADKDGKRSKRLSKSRSLSRSRYSRNEKCHKDSRNHEKESSERKRSGDRYKTSDSHHARSSSYRRDSRDSSISKYRETREHESRDSNRKRRRSRSRDSGRYNRR